MQVVTIVISLALGIQIGYYFKDVKVTVRKIRDDQIEKREARSVGVVRIQGNPITKSQPIDLSSDTGGVLRPAPGVIEETRLRERDRVLQENHR